MQFTGTRVSNQEIVLVFVPNRLYLSPTFPYCFKQTGDWKAVPLSIEALTVLCYEGVAEKFEAELKEKKRLNVKTLPTKTPETKHLPCYNNKLTNSVGGNRKFGGWKDSAVDRLMEIRKELRKTRKGAAAKREIDTMENEVLTCIRVRLGLEAPTREAELRNKRAKKRKQVAKPINKSAKQKLLEDWDSDGESVQDGVEEANREGRAA